MADVSPPATSRTRPSGYAGTASGPRHIAATPGPRHGRRWRVLGWISITLSMLMVAGSLAAYGFYRKLQGNIDQQDVTANVGADRPKKLNKSMNILILGSDSRAGENRRYGTDGGQRSDTTMLLHISPGGEQAVGISFPRDSMVQVPSCRRRDGSRTAARLDMLNAAYSDAGASCTWKMIESLTRIHIDHFVEVDFSGFKRVVDALGGVEICLPQAVIDPKAELRLRAGRQTVRGEAALGYVRTRTGGLGDGSDLSRINRQKKFMASVVQKATGGDLLTDPGKAFRFLDAVTKSISTDKGFTVGAMRRLADGLKGMSAGKVRFITVPVQAWPPDRNRVQWIPVQAEPLFEALRRDNALPAPAPAPGGPAKAKAYPGAGAGAGAGTGAGTGTGAGAGAGTGGAGGRSPARPPLTPSRVSVRVFNATGISGHAGRAASALEDAGFRINGTPGTLPSSRTAKTQIRYGPGAARQAATLAAMVPGTRPVAATTVAPGQVALIVGHDWNGLAGRAPAIPKTADEVRANQNICKGG